MAPDIMLLRMKIRINIVRCIDVNKIEITVLSARVLDALSVRGLKAKTVRETRRGLSLFYRKQQSIFVVT
mgnify:FL=1